MKKYEDSVEWKILANYQQPDKSTGIVTWEDWRGICITEVAKEEMPRGKECKQTTDETTAIARNNPIEVEVVHTMLMFEKEKDVTQLPIAYQIGSNVVMNLKALTAIWPSLL